MSLCKFADIFKDDEPGNISFELFLYKRIIDRGVQDTFPNVAIALRMYLLVTNCSAERSFSKLKVIENHFRKSMTQGRLVNLAIMSIEPDILREIDFTALPYLTLPDGKGVLPPSADASGGPNARSRLNL